MYRYTYRLVDIDVLASRSDSQLLQAIYMKAIDGYEPYAGAWIKIDEDMKVCLASPIPSAKLPSIRNPKKSAHRSGPGNNDVDVELLSGGITLPTIVWTVPAPAPAPVTKKSKSNAESDILVERMLRFAQEKFSHLDYLPQLNSPDLSLVVKGTECTRSAATKMFTLANANINGRSDNNSRAKFKGIAERINQLTQSRTGTIASSDQDVSLSSEHHQTEFVGDEVR